MEIAVIGGGAAGFFSAIAVKENFPNASVVIFEKSQNVLAKVKITGGGRCNVTNGVRSISELCKAYPRGGRSLKNAFHLFSTGDTMKWFEKRGVPLVTQSDNCVFPASQDSQTIIDCFLRETKRLKITIETGKSVKAITPIDDKLEVSFTNADIKPRQVHKVIVTTGGSPKKEGLKWLEQLNHKIEAPVPSLFTFNIPNNRITDLMGIVVDNALVSIQGTRLKSDGPLLITHWGMSGPAILKLSSYGARLLSEKDYIFTIQVNWVNEQNYEAVANSLLSLSQEHSKKLITNIRPYALCARLWVYLLEKSELPSNKKWGELGKKGINKLANLLTNDNFLVKGKSTFRDEFVT
ncbi:MAG: aminoacetone oxidase family FAD-binding enzyme, partial [Bacteroidales bacterium]|nr:aminoacetone oxidase family FAD-binding enzyme [Bacteroidales bacterium]